MQLIFFGSGEFGLPTLKNLTQRRQVLAVVSQPDRPAGRKRVMTPTPVAAWAQQAGLLVIKSADVNEPDFVARIRQLGPQASVVIAFGQKLSPDLIDAAGRLVINLHASLLPRHRGAAPINWAMIRGEVETGVSVISLAQRMDAGLIYAQQRTPIDPQETAGELHDRLALMGPTVVEQVLDRFEAGALQGQPQDESQASRAPKLGKSDGTVDFNASGREVRCRVHGLTPWPGVAVAWVDAAGDSHPLLLRRVQEAPGRPEQAPGVLVEPGVVAVRDGVVKLLQVQEPGGKVLAIEQFIRGRPMKAGELLHPVHT